VLHGWCGLGAGDEVDAWREPRPIGDGLEPISPYLDRIDQRSALFADRGGERRNRLGPDHQLTCNP
jgi:hypothetical protein